MLLPLTSVATSMSRRGNCWDHAVVESFFSSLKKERIQKRIYKTRDLARRCRLRLHRSLYNRNCRYGHRGGVNPRSLNGRPREAPVCLLF